MVSTVYLVNVTADDGVSLSSKIHCLRYAVVAICNRVLGVSLLFIQIYSLNRFAFNVAAKLTWEFKWY